MKQENLTILSNTPLTRDVFMMVLQREYYQDCNDIRCGQFVNLRIDSLYLRRPISVCDYQEGKLTLLYKVVGEGTQKMSQLPIGATVDVLTGLGNGYNLTNSGNHPLLLGGGVGVPPLYMLCKQLVQQGAQPTVVLGFNTKEEVFYFDEFRKLCNDVHIATADGSCGIKGFVTDVLPLLHNKNFTYFYTCGPEPMLKAVYNSPDLKNIEGEFSFEERMGCGFGACMGCSCKTITGYKRICKEGPVLKKNEISWR